MFQLSVYHISLGRGITTDMSQYVSEEIERALHAPQNHVSQKRRLKSSPVMSTQERVNIMYELIKKFNKITRLGIQNRTEWICTQFTGRLCQYMKVKYVGTAKNNSTHYYLKHRRH